MRHVLNIADFLIDWDNINPIELYLCDHILTYPLHVPLQNLSVTSIWSDQGVGAIDAVGIFVIRRDKTASMRQEPVSEYFLMMRINLAIVLDKGQLIIAICCRW